MFANRNQVFFFFLGGGGGGGGGESKKNLQLPFKEYGRRTTWSQVIHLQPANIFW